jgi:hypothetical protein
MQDPVVRRFCCLLAILWAFGLLVGQIRADVFQLTTGKSITGELLAASATEAGVQIKVGEGEYEKVPWTSFSQEDLKKFAQNKKLDAFVEPFIEISQEEKIKNTEVKIKPPERLPRPTSQSLFGALSSSGPGLFIILLLYGANIFAGYEIAIFKGQSIGLVCGISAVLPVIGPIIFLAKPMKLPPRQEAWTTAPEAGATAPDAVNPMQGEVAVNPMQGDVAAPAGGLKISHAEPAEAGKPALPATTSYARGQFTFNRRFFETKFPGFFGVVRRDAEKDMLLVIKSARGEFPGQRITRIAANDLHLQVQRANASEEVMIPFQEIKEIHLRHKDAT